MSLEVRIPSVGESITVGTLATWHKNDGSHVEKGEVLLTLETDKISTEVTAEESGTLRIEVQEGQEVEIGAVVARLESNGNAPAGKSPSQPAESRTTPEPALAPAAREAKPAPDESRFVVAPTVEQFARENGVDLSQVEGTGAKGRILKTDVEAFLESSSDSQPEPAPQPEAKQEPAPAPPSRMPSSAPAPASPPQEDESGRTSRSRMSPLRRKIAEHLVSAQQTAAILTTFNEVDMSAVMQLRKTLQDSFVAKYGLKLGFMSFFVRAVVDALKTVPQVNGRIDGTDIVQNHFFDIGVAIGTEKGLIVPVLRECDKKSFAEIEQEIIDYATRAREGKIVLHDLEGGVITISNGGVYGSLLSTPILNFPQSAILGMHAITERPVARNGEVVIRPIMNLALSYDHRLIDGKEAVTFLVRIKECIEQPTRLMVGA